MREDNALIDYDALRETARQVRPQMIIAGGSAYPRIIDFKAFREIADEVGAYLLVDMAHFAGLVAGGAYPSPLEHAHVCTTTTHKTLRGPRGGMILSNDLDLGKKFNSAVFPGMQGGPLMHVIAAKAVAFGEALRPEFKAYARDVIDNCRAMGGALTEAGFCSGFRRDGQPSRAGRSAAQIADRRYLRSCAGARPHHLQQKTACRSTRPSPP